MYGLTRSDDSWAAMVSVAARSVQFLPSAEIWIFVLPASGNLTALLSRKKYMTIWPSCCSVAYSKVISAVLWPAFEYAQLVHADGFAPPPVLASTVVEPSLMAFSVSDCLSAGMF